MTVFASSLSINAKNDKEVYIVGLEIFLILTTNPLIEIISTVINNSHPLNDKYKPYLKGLFIPNDYNSKNLDDWTYDIVHKDLVNLKNISLAKNLKILILYLLVDKA